MKMTIAPSILSADFGRLKEEIQAVEKAGADWIHVDVMDGHFVPNITIGPVVVEWIRKVTRLPLDVHLMITDPDQFAPEFIKAGADWVSIHPETCKDPHASLKKIRQLGIKASVAVNPDVSLDKVEAYLPDTDMLLMMTVFPGVITSKTVFPSVRLPFCARNVESPKITALANPTPSMKTSEGFVKPQPVIIIFPLAFILTRSIVGPAGTPT